MKQIIGIVSGYFNPIHRGHIEYIRMSADSCDYLVVIVNNDNQVKLKGSTPFMDETHRSFILENIRGADEVMVAVDSDKTVCESLRHIKQKYPDDELYFFNSGDRQKNNLNSAESAICSELNIKEVVSSQPKRYSSSELLKQK